METALPNEKSEDISLQEILRVLTRNHEDLPEAGERRTELWKRIQADANPPSGGQQEEH